MINPASTNHKGASRDTFQMPGYAIKPLLPYLSKDALIWEPACGMGSLVRALNDRGYRAVGTDILWSADQDYFSDVWGGYGSYSIQITNPPYSKNKEWMRRAFLLGKPFALLIPAWFEIWNCVLFRQYQVEILMPLQRINFETPSGYGSGAFFKTMWATWQLGIGSPLTYVDLNPERDEYERNAKAAGKRITLKELDRRVEEETLYHERRLSTTSNF